MEIQILITINNHNKRMALEELVSLTTELDSQGISYEILDEKEKE